MDPYPLILGLIAGGTVIIGALPIVKSKASKTTLGYLGALAGGILSYLALDTGSSAEEIVEGFLEHREWLNFGIALIVTSVALIGTWLILSSFEKKENSTTSTTSSSLPLILALGLGVHNIGEGFAIASALLTGAIASAWTFTIGFAIHNATEGIAIASPSTIIKTKWGSLRNIILLSLIAGLPTTLGASIYYLGINNPHLLAVLDTIATASLVFVMIRINIISAGLLGGFRAKFWTWLFLGIALTFGLESLMSILSMM
ncbi:MAG: ZIP family metal transporter [Sulfolobaceae archaeon]